MKLVSFQIDDRIGFGAVAAEEIVRFDTAVGAPADLKSLLAQRSKIDAAFAQSRDRVPLDRVRLLPPVPNPAKILCVATNFRDASTQGKPVAQFPLIFSRFADSFVGHGARLLKPAPSGKYDFEGELAVIIGKPGHRIDRRHAMDHVAGYCGLNDGTARDWQKHSSQFTAGKNFYRSGSVGPWLVTADEVSDLGSLQLETRVNGVVKQSISLDRMIFDVSWLIEYLSSFTPLAAGDVIATGTPFGFGSSRSPPEFLGVGDVVEVEITGLGTLRNAVGEDTP